MTNNPKNNSDTFFFFLSGFEKLYNPQQKFPEEKKSVVFFVKLAKEKKDFCVKKVILEETVSANHLIFSYLMFAKSSLKKKAF